MYLEKIETYCKKIICILQHVANYGKNVLCSSVLMSSLCLLLVSGQ